MVPPCVKYRVDEAEECVPHVSQLRRNDWLLSVNVADFVVTETKSPEHRTSVRS